MAKRYILITGATSGIGLATARALAAQRHQILIHGRNAAKGRALVESLRTTTSNPDIQFIEADFASLDEVRRLAAHVMRVMPHLDVLINNAGVAHVTRTRTKDGYEATFAVNHLAPFLLTNLLLPTLKSWAPSRIINVASAAHRQQHMDFDDLMSKRHYKMRTAYGRSKLANILFTRSLASRLAGSGVTANCLHPGVVKTTIGQANFLTRIVGSAVMWAKGAVTPEEGARTSVFLASSPQVETKSGGYYYDSKIIPYSTSADALSDAVAERLWEVSARLVKL